MTDDELKAIEADADAFAAAYAHDMAKVVAEVRRLRGLVKLLEWGSCDGCGNRNSCTECGAERIGEWSDEARKMVGAGRHRPDCPAFTESGDVR